MTGEASSFCASMIASQSGSTVGTASLSHQALALSHFAVGPLSTRSCESAAGMLLGAALQPLKSKEVCGRGLHWSSGQSIQSVSLASRGYQHSHPVRVKGWLQSRWLHEQKPQNVWRRDSAGRWSPGVPKVPGEHCMHGLPQLVEQV